MIFSESSHDWSWKILESNEKASFAARAQARPPGEGEGRAWVSAVTSTRQFCENVFFRKTKFAACELKPWCAFNIDSALVHYFSKLYFNHRMLNVQILVSYIPSCILVATWKIIIIYLTVNIKLYTLYI